MVRLVKTLIPEKKIQERVHQLAREIARDFSPSQIHVLFVLKGAFIFCADIVRAFSLLNVDIIIDYVIAKSYVGKESTGNVNCLADVEVKGKQILLIEDIIDTGRTIKTLKEKLTRRQPESLRIVCLLDKPERREVNVTPDYIGFQIEDKFVVGYGLDHDERYRHLPFIAEIE
ncbi:MAG: hypoxanthine phosphoribosyltransferase [Deltaproteobacteria bacterium]|nr:hypoxanthine phosphoribosyltransferase [Deltaproteobacteria bacterium]